MVSWLNSLDMFYDSYTQVEDLVCSEDEGGNAESSVL
jgi:hypothetical protein